MDFDWLKILEIFGLFFGISYVIGAILEKKWCWYAGIIATILYGIQVFYGKLYGEFILQFFYLAISFYGLSLWKKSKKEVEVLDLEEKDSLQVSYSSFPFFTKVFALGVLLSVILYFGLVKLGSTYPFWDALTTGFGITTTYLTAKKKIDNWIFWIIIDVILSIIMYLKGWHFYSGLYAVYVLFAAFGWWQWNNTYKKSLSV